MYKLARGAPKVFSPTLNRFFVLPRGDRYGVRYHRTPGKRQRHSPQQNELPRDHSNREVLNRPAKSVPFALRRQYQEIHGGHRHLVPTAFPASIASHNLVHLLKKDPSWLEKTLDILKPDNEALKEEYKAFYLDSLSSFVEFIETSPDFEPVLNRLIHAGFGNLKFAKQYRRTLERLSQCEELERESLGYMAEREASNKRANAAAMELRRLHEDLERLQEESRDEIMNTEPPSFLDSTVQFMQDLMKAEETRKIQIEQDKLLNEKREALMNQIRHQQRLLQTNQTLARMSEQQAAEIGREREHLRKHLFLSEHEMQVVSAALDRDQSKICQVLALHIRDQHAKMLKQLKDLDDKTDLTKPHEWYPYARLDRRKIIYHGGPTNSGKTFQALERLKQAEKGMYLGPLRLLAVEVFEKLTASGVYCSLYTGQEIQKVPFETHGAATIEMANLTVDYDVIIIDEIQMISDKERGFAWTRALLGSRCKEIHVCGGLEAKDLVERIAASCGDDFELRTYERFTELKVAERSLAKAVDESGSYKNVRPGDCVVAFSRKDIFAIKREIETKTRHKCCVIYGSLPPLTRTEQARRFNDQESGFDILVASDAVGMGLNLNIKRIIFNSMYKEGGSGVMKLDHSMVKQISGRAGRRNSPFPDGEVTCRSPDDMAYLRKCMSKEVSPIQSAGLVPTAGHVELFHDVIESYGLGDRVKSLHNIIAQFSDMAKLRSDYFLCRQTPMMIVAKQLAKLDLPIRDKYTLCMSPVVESSRESVEVLKKFAAKLAAGEVPGLPQNLRPKRPTSFDDLSRLCSIYSHLELFLWLQNEFPPVNLMEQQAAMTRKDRTIELIGEGLGISDKLKLDHSYINRDKRLRELMKPRQEKSRRKGERDDADRWMVDDL